MYNRHLQFRRFTRSGAALALFAGLVASLVVTVPAQAQGATQFVFQGAGWGHGVGMSQNGARNMANAGHGHVAILNTYYPNTIVSPTAPLDNIRVHVGDATRIELSSTGSIVFERGGVAIVGVPSGSISISAHDGGLQIGNAWTTATRTDPVMVTFPNPVKVSNNGHSYLWGRFQLTNRNGKVRVVEVLPLEKYVAGIAEMPAAWPLEALMAQAIAARTYAHEITLHRRNSTEWAQEYDISGTTLDQNYIGWDAQDSAWDQKWLAAVSATAGVEIVNSSGPIRAYYSASNGGHTETAAYVFNNDVAYTVAAVDPFDAGGHDWTSWTRTYSQSSISRWLNASPDTAVGTLSAINVLGGAGASARLDKAVIELVGSSGTKRVTGKRLMVVMNAGIFGEGGGLAQHLPGTFTTIGNGIGAGAPKPGGVQLPATVTPDPAPDGIKETTGFAPPPGWTPEPGTGVPRSSAVQSTAAAASTTAADSTTASTETSVTTSADGRYVPPAGWAPVPGTGVPPVRAVAPAAPTASGTENATPETTAATTEPTAAVSAGFVPPAGWTPTPGTGVPPGSAVAPGSTGSANATAGEAVAPAAGSTSTAGDTSTIGGTGGGAVDEVFVPPPGWTPVPGTGIAPLRQPLTAAATSIASAVLLISREVDASGAEDVQFRVMSPTEDIADEAAQRLRALQSAAAVAMFADLDIDAYIASVAPRPVQGVCTSVGGRVICATLEAIRDGGS